jgi:hypothetical protein
MGLVAAGAGTASAQPYWAPNYGRFYDGPERAPMWRRDRAATGPIAPQQVAYIVGSLGLDPVGPPLRTGRLVVQRASDEFGRAMQVTVDLNNGRVVSVARAAPPVSGEPYEGYRAYGPGPYARVMPDDDDGADFAPPRGPAMGPRGALPPAALAPVPAHPPAVIEAPRHPTKSATATPSAKPPVPRKRPQGAETARKAEPGSVAPLQATPAPAPAAPTPTQGATPPAATTMPPVAPLE